MMLSLSNRLAWIIKGASAALLMTTTTQLYSAGFSIREFIGGTTLGRNHAGGAAVAEDAITVFTNPAGLTRLSDQQWVLVTNLFAPSAKFHGTTDAPMNGGDGGDAGILTPAPNFYYAKALSDRWTIGFAFNSPFGLSLEYERDWVGRYYVIDDALLNINLNPGVGFKVNEVLSVGAGINLNYAKFELSSAIDFGTILGTEPQTMDGFAELDGDNWAWGFNLGALLTLSEHTRIGIAYRSDIKHTIKGDADFTAPEIAKVLQPLFTDTTFKLSTTLPESISMSLYHQLTPRLAVMTDLTYTRWSRFREMRTVFGNSSQPDSVTPRNWHNTWRVAVGLDYTYSPVLRFQAGLAFDESAIPDETFDPIIPASEMILLSLGAHYQYSDTLSLGFGYVRIIPDKQDIYLTENGKGTLSGEMDVVSNVLGVQLDWYF
ncbi:MAG: outer membrane protein transport protein [Pseudomonadota bacterium]